MLNVPRSSYYYKRKDPQPDDQELITRIEEIIEEFPGYGYRRVTRQLHREHLPVNHKKVLRIMRERNLTRKRKRRFIRTTNSNHRCKIYPNLLMNRSVTELNQVWVADITYLETERGFCYLSLVTDAYSRYIVGYDLSTSLSVEGALRALEMAIKQAPTRLDGLIHHSDHGVQYTCHAYRDLLASVGIRSSMGEVGNCYENALAERMNGILKLEYGLNNLFLDPAQAEQAVCEAVYLYNFERPHLSLDYQTPAAIHATQTAAYTVFSDSFVNAI